MNISKLLKEIIKRLLLVFLAERLSLDTMKRIYRVCYRKYFDELDKLNEMHPCLQWGDDVEIKNIGKILIVRLDAIGDLVWTTPLFRELKRNCPTASIDIVVRPQNFDLVENCPYIDDIYTYECDVYGDVSSSDYIKVEAKVKNYIDVNFKNKEYDLVILPRAIYCNSGFDSIIFSFLINSRYRIARSHSLNGFQRGSSALLKKYFSAFAEVVKPQHEVEQILSLGEIIGCKIASKNTELWIDERNDFVLDLLSKYYVVVGLQGSLDNKNWDPVKYRHVFKEIYRRHSNITFVICGDKKVEDAAEIAGRECNNVINMAGKTTLKKLQLIVSKSIGYLGSDTGLAHIAAAFDKSAVVISTHIKNGYDMSAMAPKRVAPYGVDNIVLEIPKGNRMCVDECIENKASCINTIAEDRVIDAIEDIILKELNEGVTSGQD